MNTCPNCGKVVGLHSSILQGCMCQYSMQAPPQRTWVGLTDEEVEDAWRKVEAGDFHDCVLPFAEKLEAKLKEKNT